MLINYDDYEKKTDGFRAPQLEIVVNGSAISNTDFLVEGLQIDSSAGYEASSCQFVIGDVYNLKSSKINSEIEKTFLSGSKIEVKLGYKSVKSVFIGFINNINFNFSDGGIMLNVHCLDAKAILFKSNTWKICEEKKISIVINRILESCKNFVNEIEVKIDEIYDTPSSDSFPIVYMEDDNYEFITKTAKKIGAIFSVIDGNLCFKTGHNPELEISLKWGENIISFNVDVDLSDQVGGIIIKTKLINDEYILVNESGGIIGLESSRAKDAEPIKKRIKHIELSAMNSESEAKETVKAIFRKMESSYVKAQIKTIGIQNLRLEVCKCKKKFQEGWTAITSFQKSVTPLVQEGILVI